MSMDAIADRPAAADDVRRAIANELGYDDFLRYVDETATRSMAGEVTLMPNDLWLRVSENCNLKCIGCWTEGLFRKVYISIEDARKILSTKGDFRQISLTSGEPFLHPHLCDILEMCREHHPSAKIFVISNGTVPMKGRYREAVQLIDRLGLSIDGATKETYEAIRRGAVFERFVENVREIIKIRSETGFPREVCFSFTANQLNLAQLPAIMRLAAELGVPEVWAQPMEMKNDVIYERINGIHIDKVDPGERRALVDEAKAEAERLGIQFYHAAGMYPARQAAQDADGADEVETEMVTRMCTYTYSEPFQLSKSDNNTFLLRPCCYILADAMPKLIERYGFEYDDVKPVDELFNSPGFWKFRRDLAEGKAADICGECRAARTYLWKKPEPA